MNQGFYLPESVDLVINGTEAQQKASVAPVFEPADLDAQVSYAVLTTRFAQDENGFATVEKNIEPSESSARQSKALNDRIIARVEAKEIDYEPVNLFSLNTLTGLITLSEEAQPQMRGTYYVAVSVKTKEQEITRLIPAHISTIEAEKIELNVKDTSANALYTSTIDQNNHILYLPTEINATKPSPENSYEFYVASVPLNAPIPTSVFYTWSLYKNGVKLNTVAWGNINGTTSSLFQNLVFARPGEDYSRLQTTLYRDGYTLFETLDEGESYILELSASKYFPTMRWDIVFTSNGKPATKASADVSRLSGSLFIPLKGDDSGTAGNSSTENKDTASQETIPLSDWAEFEIYPFDVWGEDYQVSPQPRSTELFEKAVVSVQGYDPVEESLDYFKDPGKTVTSKHGSFMPGVAYFDGNFNGKTYNPYLISDYTSYTDIGGNWWWNNPDQNWAQMATISGLMYGYTPSGGTGEFGPNNTINRAMAARIIWNMEGEPAPRSSNSFEDVPEGVYYTDAVAWCVENGIIIGVGNNRYNPAAPVERQHFMKMLFKYAQLTGRAGKDVPEYVIERYVDVDDVANGNRNGDIYQAVNWALGNRIITGTGTSIKRITPSAYATRMQAAKILTMANLVIQGNKDAKQ